MASTAAYFTAFAGICIAVCVIGCAIAGQYGWHALSEIQKLAVFVPLAAIIGLLAFSLVRQMRPAAKHARRSALLALGIFILLLLIMTVIFRPVR